MYKISVIIPFHNNKTTIIRCIESVLSQTYKPYEIILIDDYSCDGSLDLVTSYISNIKFIIILLKNTSNLGPGFSRNVGIKNASGDYVAFLDADDSWNDNKISYQVSIMKKFNIDFIGGPKIYFQKSIDVNNIFEIPLASSISTVSINSLIFSNKFATSSVLAAKRSDLFFPISSCAEDYGCWLNLADKKTKMMLSSVPLCYYHLDSLNNGLSSNLLKMELGELKAIYNTNIGFFYKLAAITYSFIKYLFRIFKKYIYYKFIH